MARKANKTGPSEKMPAFTPMLHHVMDCPAFRSLTPLAQCLYWRLRRLAGHDGRRNGQAFYSTRDAAAEFDTHQDTVRRAFYLLQARGFIVPVQLGSFGVMGEGRATLWRLTELPTPTNPTPTKEFMAWAPGRDFPVLKGKPPVNRKQNPALWLGRPALMVRAMGPADGPPRSFPALMVRAMGRLSKWGPP